MRRRKPSAAGPERPIDTPSLAYNHMRFIAGDFIDFKESVKRPWRKGQVKELGHHCLVIEPADGSALVTIYPGKCGRVRQRHGGAAAQMPAYLDPEGQAQAASRLEADGVFARLEIDGIFVRPRPSEGEAEPGYGLPLVEPVCKDGSRLRAVPKPPPPTRDPEYIIFVQQYPCCSCAAEAPSEAHHQGRHGMGIKCSDYRCVPLCHLCHTTFTATGALPRRDRAASLALMQETQVELLTRWAERMSKGTANLVSMPMPRLVAACLALFFCLGMTACGERRASGGRSSEASPIRADFVHEHQRKQGGLVRLQPQSAAGKLRVTAALEGVLAENRAHADLVAAQLQHGPATAADLQSAVADPRHLGLALALLREMGAVDVAPEEGRLVYQLANSLLFAPAMDDATRVEVGHG